MQSFWNSLNVPFTVLAPMEGVTDHVFREIICEAGKPDVLITEFTSAESLDSAGRDKTLPRLKFENKQRPIVAQLWGSNPTSIYNAVKTVLDLDFDGIDINMGCPDRAVLKRAAGGALIQNHSLASELIIAAKEAKGKMALSVKTRLGFLEKETEKWISHLLSHNLDALTIHGRTVKELSKVPANWDEIRECSKLRDAISPDTVIIGNGDVKNTKEVQEKHLKYNVDGVMIGRGVFTNPYIFEKTPRQHSTKELLSLLLKHSDLFSKTYQNSRNYAELRRFFKIYVRNFTGAPNLLNELMKCKNHEEVFALINPYLDEKLHKLNRTIKGH